VLCFLGYLYFRKGRVVQQLCQSHFDVIFVGIAAVEDRIRRLYEGQLVNIE